MKNRVDELKRRILAVLSGRGIKRAGLFGSAARGELKKTSDVDILVQFAEKRSLLDLARMEIDLERVLKTKVDLLTYDSLNPLIRDQVLREEVRII